MPSLARADLESLLRTRKLDRTLTTAHPAPAATDASTVAPIGQAAIDARLGGGWPRGQLSELAGPVSSGRTSLMLAAAAAATARGELVALVDALDRLDVESATAAGLDLSRLLWVRGHVVSHPGLCHDTNQRALEQAIRALSLVLQAGTFGLVILDVADAPAEALRRLPFTTWLRLQRMVEGRQTACVIVSSSPVARSSAGVTVTLGIRDDAPAMSGALFTGLHADARVVHVRTRMQDDRRIPFDTITPDGLRLSASVPPTGGTAWSDAVSRA